ncbi:MAG: hypothetical protein IPO99_10200 [Nitrospira sp.]|nr:hypothetical protein [Nitrospira sp.]
MWRRPATRPDSGFLSANTCYWQIRLEPSLTTEPNRTMVSYKEVALTEDPYALDGDPSTTT